MDWEPQASEFIAVCGQFREFREFIEFGQSLGKNSFNVVSLIESKDGKVWAKVLGQYLGFSVGKLFQCFLKVW